MVEKLIVISLAVAILTLVVLDIILGTNRNPDDDITVYINKLSNGSLILIPYAWGVVTAHLYFGSKYMLFQEYDDSNLYGMIGAVVIIGILGFIGWKRSPKPNNLRTLALLLFGLVYGHFCWTMHGSIGIFNI
jgi:hypothetical protein